MSVQELQQWEANEPHKLELAARNWVRKGRAATTMATRIQLFTWASHARAAAATLRAMRSARLRYSQH